MQSSTTTSLTPQVSIVVPVFNDEEHVASALDSCLAQTLGEIEVIVVDDASTDETAAIVERYAASDDRIRLIQLDSNMTAFHARRVGIAASTAPFVLFLDGDDLLVPECAATGLALAHDRSADVVGFGCQVIRADGSTGSRHEAGMQPKHEELRGIEIVRTLFPVGVTAQGQLWRYLFDRELLVAAYSSLPDSLKLVRVNDLPIAFLALMRARKYVSTRKVLYRYFFQRGASGHRVSDLDDYLFNASAIDSIDAIAASVAQEAVANLEGELLARTYDSVRLSVVGRVLDYVRDIADDDLRMVCLNLLRERVGLAALASACADFCEKALPMLASIASPAPLSRSTRHVLLRTGNLGTGGVQGVLVSQAEYLVDAGFNVTIAVDASPDTEFDLPAGVDLKQILGDSRGQKLASFVELCRSENVDVIIDHHILYNERWPFFALAASEYGIPTIGWLHNFALRPVLDGSTRTSFLDRYLPTLAMTVVLSESDVAYWKLLGLDNVAYLPNPASPFLKSLPTQLGPRPTPTGPLEIVWWGRLQQSTKQVRDLIEIGAHLRDLDISFRLTIIGPDSTDLRAAQLREDARAWGIEDSVVTPGPLHHERLVDAISHAHVYVSTSAIEGYPLTLVEAQTLGLPLVMYDLPWLATLRDNSGIVSVEQGDRRAAALALAALATDGAYYAELSEASLTAARAAVSHDFARLYSDLVRGELAPEQSPEPTIADARLLMRQYLVFTERLIRRERRAVDRAQAAAARNEKKVRQLLGDSRARTARDRKNAPSVPRTGVRGWLMRILPTSMKQSSFYARHQYNVTIDQRELLLRGQALIDERLGHMNATLERLRVDTTNVAPALEQRIQDRLARLEAALVESQRGTHMEQS